MTTQRGRATADRGANTWSAARLFLAVGGIYLLVTGLVGFAVDASLPTSATAVQERSGHIFGVLETNGWHNLAALAAALPAVVVAALRPRWSAMTALLVGGSNGVVFVAFAIWGAATFWVASNDADQVVHASLAVVGIAAAAADLRRSRRAE